MDIQARTMGAQMKRSIIITKLICMIIFTFPASAEFQLGERNLAFGSWGADVFYLQRHLVKVGYDVVADGHFGTRTRRAVTAFQLSRSLTPDGIVGQDTLRLLTTPVIPFIYTVRAGDSIWKIARDFNVSMNEIITANRLPDGPIFVGQQLVIPRAVETAVTATTPAQPRSYVIQPGDTLSKIAARFDTTVDKLAETNEIENVSLIRVGRELIIP